MSIQSDYNKIETSAPSVFALLVDQIHQMSEPEQKLLWLRLNEAKLSAFAKVLDAETSTQGLTEQQINSLIEEARSNGRTS